MTTLTETEVEAPGFARLVIPIFRPVVQAWERDEDGEWGEYLGGPTTLTSWSPRADEDVVIEYPAPARDLRRVVSGGAEPRAWLLVPSGEFFEWRGERHLRTPLADKLDPLAAYCRALRQAGDVAIYRIEAEAPAPVDRPVAAGRDRPPLSPEPTADSREQSGPRSQLGFGWADDFAPRSRARRKGRELAGDAPGWKGATA